MEAAGCSEMLTPLYPSSPHHIQEDSNVDSCWCKNIISNSELSVMRTAVGVRTSYLTVNYQ